MDSLTHIVFGAALGEVVLGKKAGKKAMLWGAIANTIPDLDMLFVFGSNDPIREITIHRGFSHSIVFAVLAAPLLAWLINRLYKDKIGFKAWWGFFFLLIITHSMLDMLTTYGTQILQPFSDYRAGFSNIFIIDFVFTIPMIIGAIACLIMKRTNPKRQKWAVTALSISGIYVVLSFCSQAYASGVLKGALKNKGITTNHTLTGVTPFNILLWYIVAENDSGNYVGYYSLLDKDKDIRFNYIPRNEQVLGEIKNEYAVNRLIWFSNGFYAAEKKEDEYRFFTLKFGTPGYDVDGPISEAVPFYMAIKKQPDGTLLVVDNRGFDKLDFGQALLQMYRRVKGDKNAFRKMPMKE